MSSKGGTRTRDPRLMKQGADPAIDDATAISVNELLDEPEITPSGAQQKAQHFGVIETPIAVRVTSEGNNPEVNIRPVKPSGEDVARLVETWPKLPEPVRRSILLLIEQFVDS